jgi:hypothetical protein
MMHPISIKDPARRRAIDGNLGNLDDVAVPVGSTPSLNDWVMATWFAVAVIVVLPAGLVYSTPTPTSRAWIFALVVTTLSGARYAWIVADGKRRLYELTFWVFTYSFLGLAPLVQMRTGRTPPTSPRLDEPLNSATMVVIIAGILAFMVGLSVTLPGRHRLPTISVGNRVNLTRTVTLAVFALTLEGIFIAAIGIGTFFSNRYALFDSFASVFADEGIGVFAAIFAMGSLVVSFIALVKYLIQTRSRQPPLIVLTVLVGIALVITINPLTNGRIAVWTAAMAIATAFGLFATAKRLRIVAILWLAFFIVVYPLSQALRSPDRHFDLTSTVDSLVSEDFDALAEINNTLLYVSRFGATDGRQALGVALFWVPRKIWPEKPNDTAIVIAESRGYDFKNLSAPLWSELYVNGGWLLLLVGMFGIGIVVRSQDDRFEETLRRARAPSILACILPFYFTILLRGSLLQAMGFLSALVVSAIFVGRWERTPRS